MNAFFKEDEALETIRQEEIARMEKAFKELSSSINIDFEFPKFEPNGSDVLKGREAFSKAMSERFGKDFEPYKE